MVQITASNVAPLTFTGGKVPIALAYRTQMVAGTYRLVPRIEVQDSPVVFVGYGIVAPEKGWNDYAGLDVHGRPSSFWSTIPTGNRRRARGSSKAGR